MRLCDVYQCHAPVQQRMTEQNSSLVTQKKIHHSDTRHNVLCKVSMIFHAAAVYSLVYATIWTISTPVCNVQYCSVDVVV